ncbi:hypothetical protein BX600DRAFT_300535 [Xylariales sp. PMI_506]|nr:hypothetical protein BX600DRAFT_300535 [Xylariales sp. PMI_506]
MLTKLDWAGGLREFYRERSLVLKNTPLVSEYENFILDFVESLVRGSTSEINRAVVEDVARHIDQSGEDVMDCWQNLSHVIYAAAGSTSDAAVLQRLAALVHGLASICIDDSQNGDIPPDIRKVFAELPEFWWEMSDNWTTPHAYQNRDGTPHATQKELGNLHRFYAQLSRQLRRAPIDIKELPQERIDGFGMSALCLGLEYRKKREYAESAIVWLAIAGQDIHDDPTWGDRDWNGGDGYDGEQAPCCGPLWEKQLLDGATPADRWEFWKMRLREISQMNDEQMHAHIREQAREAADFMDQIG